MSAKIVPGHENQKSITLWLGEDMTVRLDRLSEKGGIPRSTLIRNLTVIGVEYLESCEKFGVFQTAIVLRDFGKWFKERLKERLESDCGRDAVKA